MSNQQEQAENILLMSRERVQRSVKRMAYQIAEDNKNRSDILIIGIKERGYVTAKLLGNALSKLTDREVAIRQFLIDGDNSGLFDQVAAGCGYAVLVDDVIFSGQTMFDALRKILKQIQPEIVRTAALVDRGHRTIPMEAAFAGLDLPTKLDEHVQVLTESDDIKKVVLNNSTD